MTNHHAAQKARDLSREYEKDVLNALGALPRVPDAVAWRLPVAAHLSLRAKRGGALMPHPHETVEVTCSLDDVPTREAWAAVSELSEHRTASLGIDYTQEGVERRQDDRRAEFSLRRAHLSRPLGIAGRLKKVKRKRREDWAALLADALDTFDVLPIATRFDEVLTRVLLGAGFRHGDGVYTPVDEAVAQVVGAFSIADLGVARYSYDALQEQARANAKELRERWKEILIWAHEATIDEGGDAASDIALGPRARFDAAMVDKKAAEDAAETARLRTEEKERRDRRDRLAAENRAHEEQRAAARRRRIEAMKRNGIPALELSYDVEDPGDFEPEF